MSRWPYIDCVAKDDLEFLVLLPPAQACTAMPGFYEMPVVKPRASCLAYPSEAPASCFYKLSSLEYGGLGVEDGGSLPGPPSLALRPQALLPIQTPLCVCHMFPHPHIVTTLGF